MNTLKKDLINLGVKVCGTTEDFGSSKGGLWISLEEGLLSDYDVHSDRYHESIVEKVISKAGFFLESYDSGTAMIWPA